MTAPVTIGAATQARDYNPNGPTIYALCEYPGWRIRYVGKTVRYANARLKQHLREAEKKSHRPVCRWISKRKAAGLAIGLKHLEWLNPSDDWAARERYWIERLRAEQCDLLNLTAGGEGTCYPKSAEHRAKIAAALRTGAHFNCLVCGSEFWRKANEIAKGENKFCSRRCSNRRHK